MREFLYVDDLADACIYALENWDPNSSNAPRDQYGKSLYWLNVGSDFEVSIKELTQMISNQCEYEGKIKWDESKPDGTKRKKLDTSRMSSLGWDAKINLESGIRKTIESYINENKISINTQKKL